MLTALLVLILLVMAVLSAEFVRSQCRRMLSTPLAVRGPRKARAPQRL